MARWSRHIVNLSGDVIPAATITVKDAGTANLSTLTGSNPFNADANGFADFQAAAGLYDIYVNDVLIWEDVLLGLDQQEGASSFTISGGTRTLTVDETKALSDKAEAPYVGASTFAGSTGQTITHSLGHQNYKVAITSTANPGGFLGEVYIIKSDNTIVVYNSGTATGAFEYIITPHAV